MLAYPCRHVSYCADMPEPHGNAGGIGRQTEYEKGMSGSPNSTGIFPSRKASRKRRIGSKSPSSCEGLRICPMNPSMDDDLAVQKTVIASAILTQ